MLMGQNNQNQENLLADQQMNRSLKDMVDTPSDSLKDKKLKDFAISEMEYEGNRLENIAKVGTQLDKDEEHKKELEAMAEAKAYQNATDQLQEQKEKIMEQNAEGEGEMTQAMQEAAEQSEEIPSLMDSLEDVDEKHFETETQDTSEKDAEQSNMAIGVRNKEQQSKEPLLRDGNMIQDIDTSELIRNMSQGQAANILRSGMDEMDKTHQTMAKQHEKVKNLRDYTDELQSGITKEYV